MHYNMHVHYPLEKPGFFYMFRWDWPKYNEVFAGITNCNFDADSGYCYRRELDLEDTEDFITDTTAKRFYKNRLRYMIARWGYSTTIGIMELFSEVNNLGSQNYFISNTGECDTDLVPLGYCCRDPNEDLWPIGYGKPYVNDGTFPLKIRLWQEEMLEYIKNDLQHQAHPLAVSYTGEPDEDKGDFSFELSEVDVMSFNHYALSSELNKYVGVYNKHIEYHSVFLKDKPLIHSEFGSGVFGLSNCDNGTRFKKNLAISPFTGIAGSFYWSYQGTSDTIYWIHMKPIRQFLEGVPLDEENWQVGEPLIVAGEDDDQIEVYYLRRPDGSNFDKVMGVVSNRTYNYFTNGDLIDSTCNSIITQIDLDDDFLIPIDFDYNDHSSLKISNMGSLDTYEFLWFNGSNYDKAMGVVSNRTYNFFTNGNVLDPDCSVIDENEPDELFTEKIDFDYADHGALKINNMGSLETYYFTWFNGLTAKNGLRDHQ